MPEQAGTAVDLKSVSEEQPWAEIKQGVLREMSLYLGQQQQQQDLFPSIPDAHTPFPMQQEGLAVRTITTPRDQGFLRQMYSCGRLGPR